MRLCALLLLIGITMEGQITFRPLPSPPLPDNQRALIEYLELPESLLEGFFLRAGPYSSETAVILKEREELQTEIFAETAKSPLSPARLGALHAQWEMTRRRLLEIEKQKNDLLRGLLTEPQRIKLKLLEDLSARQKASAAVSLGMSPADCSSKTSSDPVCQPPLLPNISIIPSWGPRPGDNDPDYSKVARYLGLSEQQKIKMEANRQEYAVNGIERIRDVTREIAEETARPVLDSLALGVRYAEVEALRRMISEGDRKLNAANLALLTPVQRLKFEALMEVVRLQPTVKEAQSLQLLGQRCVQQGAYFFTGFFSIDFFSLYLGDCRDRRTLEELP